MSSYESIVMLTAGRFNGAEQARSVCPMPCRRAWMRAHRASRQRRPAARPRWTRPRWPPRAWRPAFWRLRDRSV